MEQDEMMGYAAASQLTGVKLGTLYSLVARHQIPHVRIGKRLVLFQRSKLLAWLSDCAVPAIGVRAREPALSTSRDAPPRRLVLPRLSQRDRRAR